MASTKRLLKERAGVARTPIPYVTFEEDEDDDAMSDASADISTWKFVLSLDPAHDTLGEASEIGKAADSPYCRPPPSAAKKSGGILSGVARAKKSKSNDESSNSDTNIAYFAFQLDFPPNYPFKPPTITVLGTTYHPNVKQDTGAMCDDVLTGDGWGPTLNVKKICARLRKFLCDPDPDHPLEGDIAQELVEKPDEYAEKAFKHAQEHATKAKADDAMAKGKQGGKK